MEIRRGVRGGPVVREPTVEELALRFGIFLQVRNTTIQDLFLARQILEPAAARLAAEAVQDGALPTVLDHALEAELAAIAAVKEDRQLSGTLVDFHDGVLELAGSTTLIVIWKLLDNVIDPYTFTSLQAFADQRAQLEAVERSHASHKTLAKAIRVGDPVKAERIMRSHLDAVRDATRSVVENRRVDVFAGNGPGQRDGFASDVKVEGISRPVAGYAKLSAPPLATDPSRKRSRRTPSGSG